VWVVVVAFVVGAAVMFSFTEVKQKYHSSSNDPHDTMGNHIKTLTRQAARWSVASAQDESPMVAVLHANYGAGYLWALKDIATDQQISSATGIDISKFQKEITNIQDKATVKMIHACPEYGPKGGGYLGTIAGEA
jgi:hypothetical protein